MPLLRCKTIRRHISGISADSAYVRRRKSECRDAVVGAYILSPKCSLGAPTWGMLRYLNGRRVCARVPPSWGRVWDGGGRAISGADWRWTADWRPRRRHSLVVVRGFRWPRDCDQSDVTQDASNSSLVARMDFYITKHYEAFFSCD